jgi:quinol monooxygenase YgiN
VLIALDLAVLVTAVAAVSLCTARAGSRPRGRPQLPGPAAIAAATVALAALRFPLSANAAYPALTAAAAGLVWFGMTRIDGAVIDGPAPASSRAAHGAVRTGVAGRDASPQPAGHRPAGPGGRSEPATGPGRIPAPAGSGPAAPAPGIVKPAAPPYGLIAIYTLLEDRVADFDWIADQAAEEVRTHEPDTLVYVIHTVPKAPMQRIFYEIYRDRAAYDRHEQQAYIKRFVTARRPYVLATNVIELRLKYAKISPLGQAGTQAGTEPAGAVGTAGASGAGLAAATFPAGAPAQAGPRPLGRSSAAGDPDGGAYPAGWADPPAAARGRSQELPAAQHRYGGGFR